MEDKVFVRCSFCKNKNRVKENEVMSYKKKKKLGKKTIYVLCCKCCGNNIIVDIPKWMKSNIKNKKWMRNSTTSLVINLRHTIN